VTLSVIDIELEWDFYSITLVLHPRLIFYVISTIGKTLVIRLLCALKFKIQILLFFSCKLLLIVG